MANSSKGAVSGSIIASARRGRNPPHGQGNPTKCSICDSINRWAQDCPDKVKDEHDTCYSYHVVLFQSDFDHPSKLPSLVTESWNAAILDCSASKTVCGQAWFDTYIETLSNEDKSKITNDKSNSIYRFGDGKKIPALKNAKVAAVIGSQKVISDTDIVTNEVPLLLSRESRKRANMHLNFQDDTVSAVGQAITLIVTKSGHYAVPLTLPCQILSSITNNSNVDVTLSLENSLTKNGMACKLHRQIAHASHEKLLKLLKSAGKPWSHDKELHDEILKVSQNCNVCK